MEDKITEAKRAYYRERYKRNKYRQIMANEKHWYKKAREKYGKDDVTYDEMIATRNEYYREYRRNNKEKVNASINKFWERKAEEESK